MLYFNHELKPIIIVDTTSCLFIPKDKASSSSSLNIVVIFETLFLGVNHILQNLKDGLQVLVY